MSELNPSNYGGIEAVIVGYAAGDPEYPPFDKEGTRGRKQFSIPVNHGYRNKESGEWVETGTTWVRYTANEDIIADVVKGSKVRIDGAKLESKTVNDKTYFDAQFGTVTVLDSDF